MAKEKATETGAAAGATEEVKEQAKAPRLPKYRYIGPPGKQISIPALNYSFRPGEMDDAAVAKALQYRPALAEYWEVTN